MAGGIRETQGDDLVENHEINVTPFIDVMLVLLIIFMVAAPLATVDVNVDLPVSNATPAQRPDQPVYITVKPDLTLALGNEDVPAGGLATALAAATQNNREERIFLRADREVSYGDLMGVMNTLRETGYLKIALVGLETTGGGVAPAAQPADAELDAPAAAPAAAPAQQTASTPSSGGAPTP
ncbi:TonB system transport protein ExbD [Paracoccus versutus]|uniref:Biopolymer transport protein ExbD n=1 Tax=Paracoccus versutus TaxID=34007 RepID=A0AAQ0HIS6_PARVE|nr:MULTISPECIES: TonB system transport protein ExbD [Paracoccus]KGJ11301.1 biopolymer transporter ExbD [Paracoccus versutus]MBT0778153.1 TonB system transport protein ExbD [Paracoccus sp. pheM1]REG53251.1 biopolymer transport protein ExbD [Paracoccus versutus]WEJ78941.1 TonB system transport protein ExbD [Paracoccus versutus]